MLRNAITENIILPISDILLQRTISKNLKLLQKSQWWSKEKLENYQNNLLKKLIHYSYYNVPYYTNLFNSLHLKPEDIRCKEDLKKLPILKKAEIKNNFPDKIASKTLKKGSYYKGASSGSTGQPLQYLITKNAYSLNVASNLRGWYWMGYRLGDKFAKVSHNPRSSQEKKLQDKLLSSIYVDFEDLDEMSLKSLISILEKEQPKFIRSYSDPMYFISSILKDTNHNIKPKAIATTGNILTQHVREQIEDTFNCKIFDAYSCEGSSSFFECPTHECYHAAMEYAISEFEDVKEVEKGIFQGKLITTNLWNYAVPFIRYDSQDILEWTTDKCSCGRELLKVNRILGRDTDIIITPKGKRVIVHKFTIYFSKIESVDEFQVIQDEIDHVMFKLKVNKKYSKDVESDILNYWNKAIGDNVIINLEYVNEIQLTPAGKRRFIIRNSEIVSN